MAGYRYPIDTNVAGRTIIAQLESGARPACNVYLIRYACCDRETTIQEQSLMKVEREHDGQPAFCPKCRKLRSIAQAKSQEEQKEEEKKRLGSPSLFATWPSPPGSVHRP